MKTDIEKLIILDLTVELKILPMHLVHLKKDNSIIYLLLHEKFVDIKRCNQKSYFNVQTKYQDNSKVFTSKKIKGTKQDIANIG